MSASQKKSRYPGIRAFEKNERHVFFGRRLEAKKLYNLVKAKPLVVLFAKSGIGKSSLINAGLEPLIEKDFYYVVKIRLQTTAISSVEMVKNELKPYLNEAKLKTHSKGTPGLWEYLRACEFKKGEDNLTPVLVFDQFEEFFEHNKKDQEELNRELADMVSDRLPERIRESLRAIPFRDRTKEQLDWHSPIPVKFVFAIRSDRMSEMDEMSVKIPSILHNRFHLKPLGIEAAKEAIIEPAALAGDDFDTPAFTYSDPALNTMLAYLKNKNEEIESFQLQLLCRNIERTVQRKQAKDVVIQETDFGGASGIKSILNNYYEQEISELETSEQSVARKFIEEGLIVAGRRVGVSEGVEEKSFKISKDLLEKLLSSRLIRAENTHLGRSYELSHDTLVAPILQSYEIRRRQEEQEAAFKKQEEQEKLLTIERKKRNGARLLAAAGFALFLVAAAGGFLAAKQSEKAKVAQQEAERLKKIAYTQREKAQTALAEVEKAQLEMAKAYLSAGKSDMNNGEYKDAIQNFKTVKELKTGITDSIFIANKNIFEEADDLIRSSSSKSGVKQQFNDFLKKGDNAAISNKHLSALSNYRKARKIGTTDVEKRNVDSKISESVAKLLPQFRSALSGSETFFKAENAISCSQGKKKLKEAEAIFRALPARSISAEEKEQLAKLKRMKQACQ